MMNRDFQTVSDYYHHFKAGTAQQDYMTATGMLTVLQSI